MNWRGRAWRSALLVCQIVAVLAVIVALILHFDIPLAHRLGGARVGAVTVAAVLSGFTVLTSAWTYIGGPLGFLRKHAKQTYESKRDQAETLLATAAADLGEILRTYADKEITARGLKYPEPLPVHWRRVAGPSGPSAFVQLGAQNVDEIGAIAGRLLASPIQRFVLIGEPGSGKTAVTLFLQRDLVPSVEGAGGGSAAGTGAATPAGQQAAKPAKAAAVAPAAAPAAAPAKTAAAKPGLVPLVLSLSTWNSEVNLLDWATARLEERYPNFARPLTNDGGESVARRLIHERRIRLVLDAMDELPEDFLQRVFTALNELGADFPVIVTCRTADYLNAGRRADALGESCELARALTFELLPPHRAAIEHYLAATMRVDRWRPIFAQFDEPRSPLAQALSTPLMIWLTRRVYQRKPERLAELLAAGRFPDRTTVENHLLDNLIAAVYEGQAPRVTRYFTFIAEHVMARAGSEYQVPSGEGVVKMVDNGQDIAWWRLVNDRRARWVDRLVLILVGGVVPGACVGLGWTTATWNWLSHPAPLLSGLALGVLTTVSMGMGCLRNNPPPTGTRFGRPGPLKAPVAVLGFALFVGAAASLAMSKNLTRTWFALIVAMPVALAYTFTNPYVDAARVRTPLRHYRADIHQSTVYFIAYGLGVGCLSALYRGWPIALPLGVTAGVAGGFTYGAAYKIAYGRNMPPGMVAWVRFRVAHLRLAVSGRLPWRYFSFLERAHERGVLRQSGGNYQFSHITLRDRLALEPTEAGKELSA